jgi:hypothetical protein
MLLSHSPRGPPPPPPPLRPDVSNVAALLGHQRKMSSCLGSWKPPMNFEYGGESRMHVFGHVGTIPAHKHVCLVV